MAAACLLHYRFPVQVICLLPDATVVDSLNVNDLIEIDLIDEAEFAGFSSPFEMRYHDFLVSCIGKAYEEHGFAGGQ